MRKKSRYQHSQEFGKKLIPTPIDDFEGFKTAVEEVTAEVVEIPRELELEMGYGYMTELLQFHGKTLMQEQRRRFLEMETTPSEDAVEIVNMTTKDLECYINLIDKVAARL